MPNAPAPSTDAVVVQLSRPLGTRSSLSLRRLTAAELRPLPRRVIAPGPDGRSGATMGDLLEVAAKLAGLALDDLDPISSADALALVEVVNGFLAVDTKAARAERVRTRADGALLVKLARPLEIGSEKLEGLVVLPCTAKHLRDCSVEPNLGDLLALAGRLTLQAEPILDRLDVEDAMLLLEVASGFFSRSRPTGA